MTNTTTPRKTVPVADVFEYVSNMLALDDESLSKALQDRQTDQPMSPAQAFRFGLSQVMERVLMDTNNYSGFRYNSAVFEKTSQGETLYGPDGFPVFKEGYDETLRSYYTPKCARR